MRRFLPAALLLVSACSHEKVTQYPFRGNVVSVDPQGKVATIHNEDVPGWMTSMTMEYDLDADQLKSLHAGENITAKINVTPDKYWLSDIKEAAR